MEIMSTEDPLKISHIINNRMRRSLVREWFIDTAIEVVHRRIRMEPFRDWRSICAPISAKSPRITTFRVWNTHSDMIKFLLFQAKFALCCDVFIDRGH